MANQVEVPTKKPMTQQSVEAVFDRLNREQLHGLLTYECYHSDSPDAWGPITWMLKMDGRELRVCWLKNDHTWELRSSTGSHFEYWVADLIEHSIAKEFDGLVIPDATGEELQPAPEKYMNYKEYITRVLDPVRCSTTKRWLIQEEQECVPAAFRIDTGDYISREERDAADGG